MIYVVAAAADNSKWHLMVSDESNWFDINWRERRKSV